MDERSLFQERFSKLCSSTIPMVISAHDGGDEKPPTDCLVFAGSFNPLHEGHREIASVASKRHGEPIQFEISVRNVDKPMLSWNEIQKRIGQFESRSQLWLTNAPTFEEKLQLFQQPTFVMGADTFLRLNDLQYYRDARHFEDFCDLCVEGACRFLVMGRTINGEFVCQPETKSRLDPIVTWVSESEFRKDISSTQLRSKQ